MLASPLPPSAEAAPDIPLLVKDSPVPKVMWRTLFGLAAAILPGEASPLAAQGYSPEEAVRRMTVAEGFEVTLVASEPLVRQPVCIEFDDRGRLWAVQYLQYPNPEGLKRVEVDRYSRTEYDRGQQVRAVGSIGDK
jgi:hypothetical protein